MKTICQRSKTTTINEGPHAGWRLCGAQLPQGGVCWAGWWGMFGLSVVGAIGTAAGAAEQSVQLVMEGTLLRAHRFAPAAGGRHRRNASRCSAAAEERLEIIKKRIVFPADRRR